MMPTRTPLVFLLCRARNPVDLPLGTCREDTVYGLAVVSALGADFEPLATTPTLQME